MACVECEYRPVCANVVVLVEGGVWILDCTGNVGYDQRLSVWKGSLDSKQKYSLEWCSGAPVNVSDVGGLDIGYLPVTGQPICCVVGEGVQLFSL